MNVAINLPAPVSIDKRYLGFQDQFSFDVPGIKSSVHMHVFASAWTGEVRAVLQKASKKKSSSWFLSHVVLPDYRTRNIRLGVVQTDFSKPYSNSDYALALFDDELVQIRSEMTGPEARNPCEKFARLFYRNFCDTAKAQATGRKFSDLRHDFIVWTNRYNAAQRSH
ncbi:hypothetical protein [Primorskyibacter sp. S87]|uniref:hypothetical protein n=1 Tax=Primorskyibacter sp. S87 TaxID=3415126 RepID=UPI003C79B51D